MLKKIILEEIKNVLKEEVGADETHLAREVAGIIGTGGIAYLVHGMKEKLIEVFVKYGVSRFVAARVLDILEEQSVHKGAHPVVHKLMHYLSTNPGIILKFMKGAGSLITKGVPVVSIAADMYTIGKSVAQIEAEYNLHRGTPQKDKAYQETQQSHAAAQTVLYWENYIKTNGWNKAYGQIQTSPKTKQNLANAFAIMQKRNPNYIELNKQVYGLISGNYYP